MRAGAAVVVGIVLALAGPAVGGGGQSGAGGGADRARVDGRLWACPSCARARGSSSRRARSAARRRCLSDDLEAVTGVDLGVARGAGARDGDLVLARDDRLGREGYRLAVGDRVDDRRRRGRRVLWHADGAADSALDRGHRTLPRGEARDWPRFRERGYMLDAGRKYWSPDYVVQTIREMAYLKLNTLQLHLSDNNAFRLVSDRFPYLAAPRGVHEGRHPPVRGGRPQVPRDDHPRDRDARARGSDPRGPAGPRPRLPGLRNDAGRDQARGARVHPGADRRVRAAVLRAGVPHRDRRVPEAVPPGELRAAGALRRASADSGRPRTCSWTSSTR